MKLFKGFSCCNADSIQTIPSPPYYHHNHNHQEKHEVKRQRKQDTLDGSDETERPGSSVVPDDAVHSATKSPQKILTSPTGTAASRRNTRAVHFPYPYPPEDECTENSSSDSTNTPVTTTIFSATPNSRQYMIANDSTNSPTAAASTSTSTSPSDWGYPGHLTPNEYEVYVQFHNEVLRRNSAFQQTVCSFGTEEPEEYALCRWLRARKFDLKRVTQMVEEATKCRHEAAKQQFFPDGSKALGVEQSVFYALYPELFIGHTKQGLPFYITKAGEADLQKISCITTIKGLINFHWHCMVHVFGDKLRRRATLDASFKRFEGCNVMDLEGLSIVNAVEALNILKDTSKIDQLCFPEVRAL